MRFFEREELLYESESAKKAGEAMSKLWRLAREIKNELGSDGHYVDDYLSIILKFIGSIDILNMVSDCESEYSVFWSACSGVCKLNKLSDDNEYYIATKEHIKKNTPVTDDINTQTAIYFAEIIPNYLESIIDKISEINKKQSSVKFKDADNLYLKISKIVGETKMEKLNKLIKDAFAVCSFGDIITQEILSHIAGILYYQDKEHAIPAFKIITNKFDKQGE